MRPAEVGRAGNDMITMAGEAKQRITTLFEPCDTAALSHPGWLSAAALAACRAAWEPRLTRTVDQTAELGGALTSSATAVTAADAEGERRLRSVLDDFGEP